MLDYAALSALAAVVREGSFERAARALHLTPSAVSQRVRGLEERTGHILVERSAPCRATAEGQRLLQHVEAVALMEHELRSQLPWLRETPDSDAPPTLRIAVNADSLATWFMAPLADCHARHGVLFELVVEDQDHTPALLRSGQVLAAVTAQAVPLQGFLSAPLGSLRYLATASPAFMRRHFAQGVTPSALGQAPCLRFNAKDDLQARWMAGAGAADAAPPCHWIASTHGFVDAARAGLGWGMNPAVLVQAAIAAGELVELLPGQDLRVPLHWHCTRRASPVLQALGDAVRAAARERLAG